MPPRHILSPQSRAALFNPPTDPAAIVRHYTFSSDDMALIRQRRLLEAKRLLSHSDLTASEIGYRLRFRDPSYFGRFFRQGAGMTPAAFREEIREKYQRSAP